MWKPFPLKQFPGNFRGKNVTKNLDRVLSEISHIFPWKVLLEENSNSFLRFFRDNYRRKKNILSMKFTESHTIYAFFVDQLACMSKRKWRQQALVRCREGATPDMRWTTAATTARARISRDGQRQAHANLCREVRERITPFKSVSNNPCAMCGNLL